MTILQTRDLEIIHFIAKFGYCNENHIAKLCALSIAQIKRIINRLTEAGYVESRKVLANTSNYMFLTAKSAKMLDVKAVNKPFLNTLNHDTLLVDLYFWLTNECSNNNVFIRTDKEIRKDTGIFELNSKQRIPDLLINDNIAIELEISEKPKTRLQEIVNSYIVDESIKLVCYFLKSLALLQKIAALTLDNPKFRFILFEADENNQFIKFNHYQQEMISEVNHSTLLELPLDIPKRFGNYQFK